MTLVIFKRKVDVKINWALISQITNAIREILTCLVYVGCWMSAPYVHYDGIFKPFSGFKNGPDDVYKIGFAGLYLLNIPFAAAYFGVFGFPVVTISFHGLVKSLILNLVFITSHLLGMLCMATTKSSTTTLFVGIYTGLGLSVCFWAFRYVKSTPALHLVKFECSEV